MPKVEPYSIDQQDRIAGYAYHCPGCGLDHRLPLIQWGFNGDLNKPTFDKLIQSRFSRYGREEQCVSFIRRGKIYFSPQCSHGMAGKIVAMEEINETEGTNDA